MIGEGKGEVSPTKLDHTYQCYSSAVLVRHGKHIGGHSLCSGVECRDQCLTPLLQQSIGGQLNHIKATLPSPPPENLRDKLLTL